MKVLWLCNMVPGEIRKSLTGKAGSALWVDHVLSDLRKENIRLHILCRGGQAKGSLDENCSFALIPEIPPEKYDPKLEQMMRTELESFQPDAIHIWGTEFSHTLSMVNACESLGQLPKVTISIQGLCSVYAGHYAEGLPQAVINGYTFRDLVRRNNIAQQRDVFVLRGRNEIHALEKVGHVMGRTAWDKACTSKINPNARYHYCSETLRKPFYQDAWQYDSCSKHRIFASSCSYPIKGFHYLLEAFAQILEKYPDATLAVPGKNFLDVSSMESKLREGSYNKYLRKLVRRYGLEGKVELLGGLSAQQMKQQYLKANVFVLPSTIENSPNSLGEAMLLGTPCVAADVGGVSTMLKHETEGYVYQSTAPYMLAYYIDQVFSMEKAAAAMGENASAHARITHDPQKNLEDLLAVYQVLSQA